MQKGILLQPMFSKYPYLVRLLYNVKLYFQWKGLNKTYVFFEVNSLLKIYFKIKKMIYNSSYKGDQTCCKNFFPSRKGINKKYFQTVSEN